MTYFSCMTTEEAAWSRVTISLLRPGILEDPHCLTAGFMGEGIVKTYGIAAPPSGATMPMFLISVEDVDFNPVKLEEEGTLHTYKWTAGKARLLSEDVI